MTDPYLRSGPNDPKAPATAMVKITPSDTAPLAIDVKAVRIYATAAGQITLVPVAGAAVTLSVPAGLTVEHIRVQQVMATGTTSGLELFGYTDEPEAEPAGE